MEKLFESGDPASRNERAMVHERLRSGMLPRGPARELFGGHGTGAVCSCCGLIITPEQIEFEIHAGSVDPLMMHSHCLRLWFDEWAGKPAQE
jgi:hypothetical protein